MIDVIRELKPEVIVMGNHDYAVAYNADCRCAEILHDLSVYTRTNISFKLLTREQVEWLKTLKHRAELTISSKHVYIVHGAPRSPLYGYLKPDLPLRELEEMLLEPLGGFQLKYRPIKADYVLVGHTHTPFTLRVGEKILLNPGSIGQPRDGDPRASYAIFDVETGSFKVFRVKYDVNIVVEKLRRLALDSNAVRRLELILNHGRVV